MLRADKGPISAEEATQVLDEDAQLLHAQLGVCSLPIARLVLKKFTDFSNNSWHSEEQRDRVLSDAFGWATAEGEQVLRVAEQLYAGVENSRLFEVANAICDTCGDDVPAEVVERVKACCALLILDVDADFHTILAEGENDATEVVRQVLLQLEAERRSDVSIAADLPSPVADQSRATELLEQDDAVTGLDTGADAATTQAPLPSITAEQILANCVKHRLAAAGTWMEEQVLLDLVAKAVDNAEVMSSDPLDASSVFYGFLGSAKQVETMINQVVADASLNNLLQRVMLAPTPRMDNSTAQTDAPVVHHVDGKESAEEGDIEEQFVLPRVVFDTDADDSTLAAVMERTKAPREQCLHVLEAVNFDVETAVALLMETEQQPGNPETCVLLEEQQQALRYFDAEAAAESRRYMGKLRIRFHDCGLTDEQLANTLNYIREEAPITVVCSIDNLKLFLETGILTRVPDPTPFAAPPTDLPEHARKLLCDASYYGDNADDLPMRASFVPSKSLEHQKFNLATNQAVVQLKGLRTRCTISHRLPWPAIGPEAIRVGTLQHCAHILEGYSDVQLRHIAAVAASTSAQKLFGLLNVTVVHDAFIHGPVTLENLDSVGFAWGTTDEALFGALQERNVPIVSSTQTSPPHPVGAHLQPRTWRQERKPRRQNKGSLGFAPPPPAVQPVPLGVALQAEEREMQRAIEESLRMSTDAGL